MTVTVQPGGEEEKIVLIGSEGSRREYTRVLVRHWSDIQAARIHGNASRAEYQLMSIESSGVATALLQHSAETIGTARGDRNDRWWMDGAFSWRCLRPGDHTATYHEYCNRPTKGQRK